VALIENMVREDLNPVEEARACAALVEDLELSKEEVGRRVGRSRSAISNLVRLLDLPDEALALLESGELSEGHGRAILQVRGNDVRRQLARDAAAAGWSVRETENRAKLASQPGHGRAGRKRRTALDPELREVLEDAEEKLEAALGQEVKLGLRGDQIRAEIRFDDVDELLAVTRRLKRKRAA
jgi:ParB family transcriptional regulator, chromosome partitioning protein